MDTWVASTFWLSWIMLSEHLCTNFCVVCFHSAWFHSGRYQGVELLSNIVRWKWKVLVAQLCLTLCDPMNCNQPGSSVHGILQARILEWVDIPFSRRSSWPRDWTQVSCIAGGFFTIWATREAQHSKIMFNFLKFSKWLYHLHFPQEYMSSYFSISLQHFLLFVFFIIAILAGAIWYFIVVLICIFLMTNDSEHLLVLIGYSYIFLGEISIEIICQFLIVVCFILVCKRSLYSFPGGSVVKNLPANAGASGDTGSVPGLGRSPGGGNGKSLQYFLPGKFHGQRSLAVYIHGVAKGQTWLSTHTKSSLYIMYTNILLDLSFANTFSQAVACLCIFLVVSFEAQ